jgi:hypothetical protein
MKRSAFIFFLIYVIIYTSNKSMSDIKNTLTENKNEKIVSLEKSPENILTPENINENKEEIKKEKEAVLREIEKFNAGNSSSSTSIIVQDEDNKRIKQIEAIMEENLEDVYLKMPVNKQKEFKIVGEKTAHEINGLLKEIKLNIKKIVSLIIKWLLIIPGINRYYVEQEAKIKTDELVKMKDEMA